MPGADFRGHAQAAGGVSNDPVWFIDVRSEKEIPVQLKAAPAK